MSLISLEPTEFGPQQGDLVEFRNGFHQWEVTKVLAPNLYLRSVQGNRFGIYPIANVSMIWRDEEQQKVYEHYQELMSL